MRQLYEKRQDLYNDYGDEVIVAAEIDLIQQRLTGAESEKLTILPILLEGTRDHRSTIVARSRLW